MNSVLIVDDDVAVTNYFRVSLAQTEEFEPTIINDACAVAGRLANEVFDVILLDMDMPEVSGLEILKRVRERGLRTPVVVLTGVGDVDMAVKAMKLGAFDYLTKPVDDEYLLEVLRQALAHAALHQSLQDLPPRPKREDLAHGAAFEGFVTQDPKMVRLLHEAEKMAGGDLTVLVIGERGTGREALARAMHQAGRRRAGPFVAADASTEPQDNLPAMLFGQARAWGGGTDEREGLVERAAGGTLFLDHVELLGVPAQLRLKRLIQADEFYRENSTHIRKADIRLLVGSAQDLAAPDYKGAFSRDLLYHLMVNVLRLSPLRERRDDIPFLAEHALRRAAGRGGRPVAGLSPEALEVLRAYPFPGNDRELEAVVSGAAARCEGDRITPADLPPYLREAAATQAAGGSFEPRKLADVERDYVAHMLEYCGGDRKKAARELGISLKQMEAIAAEHTTRRKTS